MSTNPEPFNPHLNANDVKSASLSAMERLRREARDWNQNPKTKDITQFFIAATSHLPSGELIKDEYFTLFESVGALEIMDAKMDSGYVPPGDTFEPEFDVCGELLPAEILWIMDEILRLEMTFHDGYPLSQNMFTSLHIFQLLSPTNSHPPSFGSNGSRTTAAESTLVHTVLQAYCIAAIKTCELVLQTIQANTYFEEEDFVTYLFGRELLPRVLPSDALATLDEAIDLLASTTFDSSIKSAIKHRLVLRQSLLQAMQSGHDTQPWIDLQEHMIHGLEEPHQLTENCAIAFSTKVQRQLATSTPPRPMPDLSWPKACSMWLQLCDDVISGYSLVELNCQSPHGLWRALTAFTYRDPSPSVYARARIQDLVLGNDNVADAVSHFDLLLTDMRDLVLACDPLSDAASFEIEMPTDARHIRARILEDFMQKSIGQFLHQYCCLSQNRCRYRRLVLQSVAHWDRIQTDAQDADRRLETASFPKQVPQGQRSLELWANFHLLDSVKSSIELGIELDLVQPHEFSTFYISMDHIARLKHDQLSRTEALLSERFQSLTRPRSHDREEYSSSHGWILSLILRERATQGLAKVLADLYCLLETVHAINARPRLYADPQLQYETRNKPLLGWEHLSLADGEQFERRREQSLIPVAQATESILKDVSLIKTPLEALKKISPEQGKYTGTEYQWQKELKALEKVCVAVKVAVSQISRICEAHGMGTELGDDLSSVITITIPQPGKRYHDWFAVPQIMEKIASR